LNRKTNRFGEFNLIPERFHVSGIPETWKFVRIAKSWRRAPPRTWRSRGIDARLATQSKVFGGVSKLAEEGELNASTLSAKGNPELKSLRALLRANGHAAYGPSPPETRGLIRDRHGVPLTKERIGRLRKFWEK